MDTETNIQARTEREHTYRDTCTPIQRETHMRTEREREREREEEGEKETCNNIKNVTGNRT